MLKKEVDYRFAKWLLINMQKDEIISVDEVMLALAKIAERYNPPFLEVEDMNRIDGDGVIVDGR